MVREMGPTGPSALDAYEMRHKRLWCEHFLEDENFSLASFADLIYCLLRKERGF